MQRKLASGIIIIFGASGDLTARKLIPAIFSLFSQHIITSKNLILGIARSQFSDHSFREKMTKMLSKQYPNQDKKIAAFSAQLFYQPIDDYENSHACYQQLQQRIQNLQQSYSIENNLLFYLSTPPKLYYEIPAHLASLGMNVETDGYKRIILEKPFGVDEVSARKLNLHLLNNYFELTTIWAKRRFKICWLFVLPTLSLIRYGTHHILIMSKFTPMSLLVLVSVPVIMKKVAPFVI